MTAPEKQESTAVVHVGDQTRALMESLASDADSMTRLAAYQMASVVERTQIARAAATEIAKMQWGKSLSDKARAAVARWCLDRDMDPQRHITVLGGNIYDLAEFYIDKLAAHPMFDYAEAQILAPLDTREIPDSLPARDRTKLLAEQARINTSPRTSTTFRRTPRLP
jgi:hypothetical protein